MVDPSPWSCPWPHQGAFWRVPLYCLVTAASGSPLNSWLHLSGFSRTPLSFLCGFALLSIPAWPQGRLWQGVVISSLTWLPFHKLDQGPSSYLLAPWQKCSSSSFSLYGKSRRGFPQVGQVILYQISCVIIYNTPNNTIHGIAHISEVRKMRVGPHPLNNKRRHQTKRSLKAPNGLIS